MKNKMKTITVEVGSSLKAPEGYQCEIDEKFLNNYPDYLKIAKPLL